jgi:branched-chain amino acid transport system substrate-binding protein
VNKAGVVDATKIAYAMEGQAMKDFLGYDTLMRKDDHQIMTAYYVGVFKKGVKYDAEKTGLGWSTAATIKADEVVQPTSCKMRRPRI